ncbi:MAG: chromosome segregation protein SMC [Candidatus Eisenbacteria bacterium]|nr:chromosome segregation protein SMC [Candidatus Eisenbacteria bacterium]
MFLKKLEFLGFKSFAQKLKMEFGQGITCIVGPNGCGKTNVADAIRWVLGEQSAKALRGDSMDDVIFNGTANRKPIGMAEVALTFSNSSRLLPLEYDEITVSRRIFRNGVSEYFLNKTPCRLKDIRDMFFDTGIGSHAYSQIEQEMVDNVLSDNSGHRRFLFEEAAGIMKYKTRKREALLKLEATENDLLRVNDILLEIERETDSLRRQIAKARRYKRLEEEIRNLDVTLGLLTYRQYDSEAGKLSGELDTCLANKGQASAAIRSLEASLEKLKFNLVEEEKKVSAAAQELAAVEEQQAGIRDRIMVLKERRDALASKGDGLCEDIRHAEEKIGVIAKRHLEASSELAGVESSLGKNQEDARMEEEELVKKEQELLELRSSVQALVSVVAQTKTQQGQRSSKLEELAAMKEEMERQLNVVRDEILQLESRLSELRSAEDTVGGEIERQKVKLGELENRIGENVAKRDSLDRRLAELGEEESALLGNAKRIEGRLGALESLAAEHREQNQLIRSTLANVNGNVAGLLEDLVGIPAELSSAFDALLYEYGPVVVAGDRETALSCVFALSETSLGRFTVLVRDESDREPGRRIPEDVLSSSEVVGRAVSLISCPDNLKHSISSLLEGTVVVQTADSIRNLPACMELDVKFVTRKGGLIQKGKLFTGGRGLIPGGLEVKAELSKGTLELEDLRSALSHYAVEKNSLGAQRTEAEGHNVSLSSELRELDELIGSNENGISVRRAETRLIEARAESLRTREKDLTERLSAYSQQRDVLDKEVVETGFSLAPKSEQLDKLSELAKDLEGQREAILARVGELRMEEVRQLARKNGLVSLGLRLEEEKVLLGAEMERKKGSLQIATLALSESKSEADNLEQQAAEVAVVGREKESKLEATRVSYSSVKAEIEELEKALKVHRTELDKLSEEAHAIELSLTRQKIEREGVVRRIYSDYGVDLTAELTVPEGFDSAHAEQRVEVLREKMKGLGPVNLLALEEYEKKKERLDFIKNQRDDLLQAKTSLLEVIEKINHRASGLFLETFNSVQEKFQETFLTLFEGGAAELRLLGDDPLEADIEMVARPKGKTLQSLHLLSGGERALTAIALLFAIYLVKPSPFCILDELDAPLDDANINRFLNMLKKFNDKTQFLVITHNKKTMETADYLYGITMQEPGISKVVSVRFKDAEKPVEYPREAVAVET